MPTSLMREKKRSSTQTNPSTVAPIQTPIMTGERFSFAKAAITSGGTCGYPDMMGDAARSDAWEADLEILGVPCPCYEHPSARSAWYMPCRIHAFALMATGHAWLVSDALFGWESGILRGACLGYIPGSWPGEMCGGGPVSSRGSSWAKALFCLYSCSVSYGGWGVRFGSSGNFCPSAESRFEDVSSAQPGAGVHRSSFSPGVVVIVSCRSNA
jgi:hypothetical protein